MKKLLVLFVLFSLAFAPKTDARPIGFSIKIKYGDIDSKGECISAFGICNIIISVKTAPSSGDADSETMEVKGEIANNQFLIHLPKEINAKGKNTHGDFVWSLSRELVIEQQLAQEIGVDKLVIAPGTYQIKGNLLTLKISSTGDSSGDQSKGKKKDYVGHVTLMK